MMGNEPSPTTIEIKIARPENRDVVVEMFLRLLQFLDQFDHDMIPLRENAEFMTDTVFMPAAERRDPILIAWDQKTPVGCLFWPVQVLRILKEKGVEKLMGMVHLKNEVSIKASERMGFLPFARLELTSIDDLAKWEN
jgi:hypothetical protein